MSFQADVEFGRADGKAKRKTPNHYDQIPTLFHRCISYAFPFSGFLALVPLDSPSLALLLAAEEG